MPVSVPSGSASRYAWVESMQVLLQDGTWVSDPESISEITEGEVHGQMGGHTGCVDNARGHLLLFDGG